MNPEFVLTLELENPSQILGKGTFSRVFQLTDPETLKTYAVKQVN